VPGIFISRRAEATTTTTTIGNNERLVLDGKASCTSTQHIHIVSRDGDKDDKVKRTCYASNIDATSNLDAHEPMSHIVIHRRPRARAHQAFICNKPLCASAHGFQSSCASARATFRTVYCRLTTTTHNYAGNKPLCASARAKRQT
jgi:hypothetical protein